MELGRVLELAANHFLRESHSSSKENLDKGLNLLQRAVDILENEARPSQAGTLAMRMMTIGQCCNEDFRGTFFKEFTVGQEPVSIVHYTMPGTCINQPLH